MPLSALPALSIRQPDVPGIIARIGQQKNQEFRNQLLQDQGDRANRLLDLKERKYSDEQALTGQINQARGDYLGGDNSALAALAAVDPDGAAKLQDIVSQASTEQREVLSRQNLEMGQMAHYITTAQGPEEQAARWQQVRSSSPELAAAMPETFDQNWTDLQVARIMTTEELLKAPAEAPSGFRTADEGLEPIPGGPADPTYKGAVADATREAPATIDQIRALAQAKAEGTAAGKGQEGVFSGTGFQAQGANILIDVQEQIASKGIDSLTTKQTRAYSIARQNAERPYLKVGPDGEQILVTPRLDPTQFPPLTSKGAGPSQTAGQPGSGVTVEPIKGTGGPSQRQTALDSIKSIVEKLNAATQAGETVTGVVGAAKASLGGLARQVGIPVGTRSKELVREYEILRGVVGPLILNEKRLSETERERLTTITGGITWDSDEKDVRQALLGLLSFLENYQ